MLLCAVSGSHLYGFPSPDSDLDLKGIHLHPTRDLLGLGNTPETHDLTEDFEGSEVDLTTNEVGQALKLLLAGNGNMLERILSPFQAVDTPEKAQLQDLARGCLSKIFFKHYAGYFRGMQEEHQRTNPPQAKSLLYTFRVALTGVHLLRKGEVLPDLRKLADIYQMDFLQDLIRRKQQTAELVELSDADDQRCREQWPHLEEMLQESLAQSSLPDQAPNHEECDNWLIELRLAAG